MAFGDVGGAVTELIVTCQTPASGPVSIHKGDPVALTGNYEIDTPKGFKAIFGQAMFDVTTNSTATPVKVRGICIFKYDRDPPIVGIGYGVYSSPHHGFVRGSNKDPYSGTNLKVDKEKREVHVLL